MTAPSGRWTAVARVSGAVVGGVSVALSGSLCLALSFRGARDLGLALGVALVIPASTVVTCTLLVGRSALRTWLASGLVTLTLWAVILLLSGGAHRG